MLRESSVFFFFKKISLKIGIYDVEDIIILFNKNKISLLKYSDEHNF